MANKTEELEIKHVVYMPDNLTEGVLYVSKRFKLAIHLCACGCRGKTITPVNTGRDKKGWDFTYIGGKPTLRPSIGNFSGEKPYHAHYYITNGKIEWL